MGELTYTLVGDYYLPNLALAEPPSALPIGRYGTMHGIPAVGEARPVRRPAAPGAPVSSVQRD